MTQALLITEKSLSERDNRQVGDIVGLYSDDHVFSEKELSMFDVVQIAATKESLAQAQPEVREVTRAKTTDWTLEEPERKTAWKDKDGSYKEVVEEPRLATRYEAGAVVENYSRIEANRTTTLIAAPIAVRK